MIKRHYAKGVTWVEKYRFQLLLAATFLVLLLPAFTGGGILSEILFITCMSFLFIQSMIVATTRTAKKMWLRYAVVTVMIFLFVMEPISYKFRFFDFARLILLAAFFIFVTFHLLRFLKNSKHVDMNVIITAINIYLLFGIIGGSLAFFLYLALPGSYNIPDYITNPDFVSFNYYSFVTMSTVGYGDITPRLPQTQTLAYLIAITGQLYVAIIIAFLVGKMLMHADKDG